MFLKIISILIWTKLDSQSDFRFYKEKTVRQNDEVT